MSHRSTPFQGASVVALALALVATSLVAQGPGTITVGPWNTEALTGGLQNLGVEYTGIPLIPSSSAATTMNPAADLESVWITGRGSDPDGPNGPMAFNTNPPHTVYQLDLAGNVLFQFTQRTGVASTVWGHRDMAQDLSGRYIITGDDDGIHCFDRGGNYQTTVVDFLSDNGPQSVTFPLLAGVVPFPRGVAFNPSGNGGNGSIWAANFASALTEYDLNGNVLTTWPANGTWSVYGLAWDPNRNTLWANSSPNAGNLAEIDPTTGMETGSVIPTLISQANPQGGLGFAQRTTSGAPATELVYLTQGATGLGLAAVDAVAFARLDLYQPIGGLGFKEEVQVQIQSSGALPATGFSTSNKQFFDGDILEWGYFTPGTINQAGVPGILVANLPPDSTMTATTLTVPEYALLHALSVPATTAGSFVLGDTLGLASLVGPNVGLGPNAVGDPTGAFLVPGGLLTMGDQIRLQAFVADPGLFYAGNPWPGYATNVATFDYQGAVQCPPQGAVFTASGTNNFPGSAVAPYWSVANNATNGASILRVTLDIDQANATVLNPNVLTLNFDYDQAGMVGLTTTTAVMLNGNSASSACEGTVISDPGVIYAPGTSSFGAGSPGGLIGCDGTAFSGWSTTSALGGSCRNLTWNFTPGMFTSGLTFSWNMDTDGGGGTAGEFMEGIYVEVQWDNGCTTFTRLVSPGAGSNVASANL